MVKSLRTPIYLNTAKELLNAAFNSVVLLVVVARIDQVFSPRGDRVFASKTTIEFENMILF